MPSLINPFWFAPKDFSDNFNRTTSGSLGTSSSGQPWTALRGVWFANGSQGSSSDNAANYPIASYDIGLQNTTSKIDSNPGTGVAFWITDANSWWAAYPFYSTSSSSVCNLGLVTSTNNPPSGSCCSGVSSSSTTVCNSGLVTNTNNPPAGNCCGSVSSSSATVCNSGYTVSLSNPPAGNCCSAVGSTTFYTCGSYQYVSGSNCYYDDDNSYAGPATPGTLYDCYTVSTTTTNYSCYTASTTTTNYSCYTSYTITYTYTSSIRIISSVSGTIVTDSTTTLGSSNSSHPTIASIEVSTSGNTITAKGYSSAGQVTQLGSTITRTPSSPTKGTSIGIIKAPSDVGQSSTVDNYSVTV